jgi:hypothetical protein
MNSTTINVKFEEWQSKAEYTPLNRFTNCGNEIQICSLDLPGNVKLLERTTFWHNFLKEPSNHWIVDLVLLESIYKKKVEEFNGTFSDAYYTSPGFGTAEFLTIEDAFNFNQWYQEWKNNTDSEV